jgi:hypothetical protein
MMVGGVAVQPKFGLEEGSPMIGGGHKVEGGVEGCGQRRGSA